MSDQPPVPPKKIVLEKEIESKTTMPAEVLDMIRERGMIAVFLPAPEGIRFFVTQRLTQAEANEFAIILEDCANTVRSLYRSTPGRVQ